MPSLDGCLPDDFDRVLLADNLVDERCRNFDLR
jgi:hypothetical protein